MPKKAKKPEAEYDRSAPRGKRTGTPIDAEKLRNIALTAAEWVTRFNALAKLAEGLPEKHLRIKSWTSLETALKDVSHISSKAASDFDYRMLNGKWEDDDE